MGTCTSEMGTHGLSLSTVSAFGLTLDFSVFVALYSLTVFWICLHKELKPFRVASKFLCVKGVIFFCFWQGLLISILVSLGIVTHSKSNLKLIQQLVPFMMTHTFLPRCKTHSSVLKCRFLRWLICTHFLILIMWSSHAA